MTTATATNTTDKKAIMRDKRAQGIAAMGLVTREGDRFRVTAPTLRGRRASYEVWRDDAGKVRCSCLEFEEQTADDPGFRCEHNLAVKHSLLAKNSEAVTKQLKTETAAASAAAQEVKAVETPDTETINASERRQPAQAEKASRVAPRFVRERSEPVEENGAIDAPEQPAATPAPVASFARHTNEEEQEEMRTQRQETAARRAAEEAGEAFTAAEELNEERSAQVVPLAFTNTLRTLRQPIDPKLIKTREGWTDRQGNTHMVEYVEWHTVADLLDRVTPTWSHAVRSITQIADIVAVTAAITIDGVTREGVGTGRADNETGIKKAEHDALKRAAIKFGIARDLYQRESEVIETEGTPEAQQFPRDPLAKSMSDLVTPKQLGMIRALAREAGMDADEECQNVLRCRTEELSKRAASSFIDHLKSAQTGAAAGGLRRAS